MTAAVRPDNTLYAHLGVGQTILQSVPGQYISCVDSVHGYLDSRDGIFGDVVSRKA